MVFSVFDGIDPRKIIRTKIGTNHLIDDEMQLCISVTNGSGDTVNVPMLIGEKVELNCPAAPFIRLDLLSIKADPHNINASVRKYKALISVDITFNDAEGIDVTSFGKKVADAIVNYVRTYQGATDGIFFMNVWNEGRLVIEGRCEETMFHWILELTAENNDAC